MCVRALFRARALGPRALFRACALGPRNRGRGSSRARRRPESWRIVCSRRSVPRPCSERAFAVSVWPLPETCCNLSSTYVFWTWGPGLLLRQLALLSRHGCVFSLACAIASHSHRTIAALAAQRPAAARNLGLGHVRDMWRDAERMCATVLTPRLIEKRAPGTLPVRCPTVRSCPAPSPCSCGSTKEDRKHFARPPPCFPTSYSSKLPVFSWSGLCVRSSFPPLAYQPYT